jgi:hypothetical protein
LTFRVGRPTALARFCHRWNQSATCTASGAPVGAGPVPADHLRLRMLGQPCGQRGGVTARQQVNDSALLAVDQDGAVVVATPDHEIIDTQHRYRMIRRIRQCPHQPQQGASAGHHPQNRGEPSPGPTGEGQADLRERLSQAVRAAQPAAGQPVDLLRERPHRAARIPADEPADPQPDPGSHSGDRDIGQFTPVAPVHPLRCRAAGQAGRRRGSDAGPQPQTGIRPLDLLDIEGTKVRQ